MIESLLSQCMSWVGAFSFRIAIVVFAISFLGEGFLISIPLVFETIFLAAGYQLSEGVLPFWDMILLALMSQLGRQAGALVLFVLSRSSTSFLGKFIAKRLPKKQNEENRSLRLLDKIDRISPFGVALGRLLWLRVPLTLILGARRRLKTLVLGIAISSTVYETVYISLGAIVGKTANIKSPYMLLYFAGGLAAFYAAVFGIRMSIKALRKRSKAKTGATPSPTV